MKLLSPCEFCVAEIQVGSRGYRIHVFEYFISNEIPRVWMIYRVHVWEVRADG